MQMKLRLVDRLAQKLTWIKRLKLPHPKMPTPATFRDLHVYGGIAIACVGVALSSVSIALVVLGVALAGLGLGVPRRSQKGKS